MLIRRNIRAKLDKALSFNPVVLLTGARQTGKSTLMHEIMINTIIPIIRLIISQH